MRPALTSSVSLTTEEAAHSTLLMYEPDLLTQIAELLLPSRDIGDKITTAAVLALDACAHYRSKMSEVLTAISANVNHGILISLFRHVVGKIVAGRESVT
jgi:E3 ubiquitin-protein ligase HUWE1